MRITTTLFVGFSLALAGCQTGGSNGILGSVGNNEAANSTVEGTNPNDGRRLKNTQNRLTNYCPRITIRAGTETLRIMPRGVDTSEAGQVRYQATITQVARECSYVGDQLRIRVGAKGRVITGPKGVPGTVSLPLRVAVQQGNCSRHFRLTEVPATIAAGQSSTLFQLVDNDIIMPAPSSINVQIFVGFDETRNAKASTTPCTS